MEPGSVKVVSTSDQGTEEGIKKFTGENFLDLEV
jgi:hypothetical protein